MMRERGAGKVEFLAQREMILKDLTAGWPMKVVWRRLKNAGTMSIEYPQFRQYSHKGFWDIRLKTWKKTRGETNRKIRKHKMPGKPPSLTQK